MSNDEYSYDQEAAAQSGSFSFPIDEGGAYVGMFTRAQPTLSKGGANGIDFSFESLDSRTANYLTLWTHSKDGKPLFGLKTVQGIMAVLGLKKLTLADARIQKWNVDAQRMVEVDEPCFTGCMGKLIGLILQKEFYKHSVSGEVKYRMNIVNVFDEASGLTGSEVAMGEKKPVKKDKFLASLKDKNPNLSVDGGGTGLPPSGEASENLPF